ncbi:hypothetical protein KC361_g7400 [Hortaea werneckii]|nr:hypothetical protein KC361_g7400 [Hortaea werneckii]
MGVSTRHKSPSPREFLLVRGGNIQKRPRQDTLQPPNFTRPTKRSRKDSVAPSLARNEKVVVEDALSDMDEDEDYHGSGAVTLQTFVGPLTVDARVAIAVQHLLFDGPDHPLYAGHMDAIISQFDGKSIAESGYHLQQMCEFIHAQASELDMVPKGSQLEEEVSTVWAKKQGQTLAEQIRGTSAFPDVIAAMVMEEAQHHSSSDKLKDILRAVENKCDKQAQAPVGEDIVPRDSAGPDEHLTLQYHPEVDAPAAIVAKPGAPYRSLSAAFCQPFGVALNQASSTGSATEQAPRTGPTAESTGLVVDKPDTTYRPLSATFCQPFSATPGQSFSTGFATKQASKTGPTAGPTGFHQRSFSAASAAEKFFPSGPAADATRYFPRSGSVSSTSESSNGSEAVGSSRSEPGQEQRIAPNSNVTRGSADGRFGYGHPLHNWIVKPAVKVEEVEQDGNAPVHSTSAQNVTYDAGNASQSLQQADNGHPPSASAQATASHTDAPRSSLQQATNGAALYPTSAQATLPTTSTFLHELQVADLSESVVVEAAQAKNRDDSVANTLQTVFLPLGRRSITKLCDGRWLVRLANSGAARRAASSAFILKGPGWIKKVTPRFYEAGIPQRFTATVPISINMRELLISIATLYKRPFCLQYSDNTPFSLKMVLTLSQRIAAKRFRIRMRVAGSNTTVCFATTHVPVGPLTLVPTPPEAQPYHLDSPPTADRNMSGQDSGQNRMQ